MDASRAAAQQAKENVTSMYENATRVLLSVNIKAPDIIVPQRSTSLYAFSLDMGNLLIENNFITLNTVGEGGQAAVIDDMKLQLSKFSLSRVKLNESHKIIAQNVLLSPLTFVLAVKRNLSAGWYNVVPDLHICGEIDTIEVFNF